MTKNADNEINRKFVCIDILQLTNIFSLDWREMLIFVYFSA